MYNHNLEEIDVDSVLSNLKESNELDQGFIEEDCLNEVEAVKGSPDRHFEESEDVININRIIGYTEESPPLRNTKSPAELECLKRLSQREKEVLELPKKKMHKANFTQLQANLLELYTRSSRGEKSLLQPVKSRKKVKKSSANGMTV